MQLKLLHNSAIDPLSQLLNRQSFEQQLTDIMHSENCMQTKKIAPENSWFLAMLDIDHFKKVNDTYGHVIGDEVIVLVSQLLKSHFRFDDLLFRYGGEEFAILFSTSIYKYCTRKMVKNIRKLWKDDIRIFWEDSNCSRP